MKVNGKVSYQLSIAIALLALSALLSVGLTQAKQNTAAALSPPEARAPLSRPLNGSISSLEQSFEAVADQVGKSVVTILVKQKLMALRPGGTPQGFGDDEFFKSIPPQFRDFFQGPRGKGQQRYFFRYPNEETPEGAPQPQAEQPEPRFNGVGSGFVIRADGHILTNAHVVRSAEALGVRLSDGTVHKAKLVGQDAQGDLAVIKAETGQPLAVSTLGDSEKIRVGQFAVAVGTPMGMKGTVSLGIVSGTNRTQGAIPNSPGRSSLIQTDAHITFGNSGGPLCNLRGEVIGVNTMISRDGGVFGGDTNSGFGFAIPINEAKQVADRLISHGKVSRGLLGIKLMELTPDLIDKVKANKGVVVYEVTKDSPADKAGIQKEDVIQKIDGKEVTGPEELQAEVRKRVAGDKVTLSMIRAGKPLELTATLADLSEAQPPKPEAQPAPEKSQTPKPAPDAPKPPAARKPVSTKAAWRGMGVQNLDPAAREYYKLGQDEKGALVSLVEDGSAAAAATIEVGDVVKEVNRQPIAAAADFEQAVKAAGSKDVMVLVKRDGRTKLVTIKP